MTPTSSLEGLQHQDVEVQEQPGDHEILHRGQLACGLGECEVVRPDETIEIRFREEEVLEVQVVAGGTPRIVLNRVINASWAERTVKDKHPDPYPA